MPSLRACALLLSACAPAGPPTFGSTDEAVDTVLDTDDGVAWTLGPEVRCADPAARLVAPFRPHDPGGDWAEQPVDPASPALYTGGGLAVGDLTGDGLLDLLVTAHTDAFAYWVQVDGLGFVDARDRLPPLPAGTAGVSLVDLDDDGDLDAFVSVYEGPDVALVNDGHGRFTDAAEALGLQGPPVRQSLGSSWGDLDGDGDLDGFVAGYGPEFEPETQVLPPGHPSSLYVRGDDGTFTDRVPEGGLPDVLSAGHTFGAAFLDVDLDGAQDLYVVQDFGWSVPGQVLHNDGGVLAARPRGAESDALNMGLGVGDTNGDELPDLLVAAWDRLALFQSDGTGRYADVAKATGLEPDVERGQDVGWGAELADLDDDGDLDAVAAFGHLALPLGNDPEEQPDGVWLRDVYGRFEDVAPTLRLDDRGTGRGVLVVDLDRNGFLDLVRTDLRGPTTIDLGACDDHAWLRVELRQPAPNVFAIGARVRVGLGDRVLVRELRAGGTGFASGGPPEVHLGLGTVDEVDWLEVVWPDGTVSRREHVPTRRSLVVSRPPT
jgi:hypothetical protein